MSYSVAPFIALDETRSRLHWVLTYAPGFTFYQRMSSMNEADQNLSIDFQYRLSPHVTFTARDGFQKSSSVFNQPFLAAAALCGGTQEPNFSVIAPIADRSAIPAMWTSVTNSPQTEWSEQMEHFRICTIRIKPRFLASSIRVREGGSAFYTLRVSKMHYIGATYQYQRLITYPTAGQSETQTHALLFFYTLYATSKFSISFFGGPQHSDTVQPPQPPLNVQLAPARTWIPAAGASMNWQGRLTNVAISYSHVISDGGGLIGAVQLDSASASIRQQLRRRLSGSLVAMYAQNNVLGSTLDGATNGHTLLGTASLQQEVGQHINVQLGYTRLHQDYSGVAVLAANPNTNREYISISYSFYRPLGR